MDITLQHNGKTYANWDTEALVASGVPQPVIATAVKASAVEKITAMSDGWRVRVASRSAGKLMEWLFKSQIAADPASADSAELALLDREAAARGMDRGALLALIATKAAAYRQAALLIAALQAEAKAAIAAIADDDPGIAAQTEKVLGDAKTQAEAALAETFSQITEVPDHA